VSLAWTTVVLLVLLLPGFLFVFGMYAPERMSGDTVSKGTLVQLSGVILVSTLIHGGAFLLVNHGLQDVRGVPLIRLDYVFAILNLSDKGSLSYHEIHQMFQRNAGWILLYLVMTYLAGYLTGYGVSMLIIKGPLREIIRHGWIYDLVNAAREGGPIHAYVLTNIQSEKRILMFRGYLKTYFFDTNGKISYLILREVERYYMNLGEEQATTTSSMKIGDNNEDLNQIKHDSEWSIMMISGENIANVMFERHAISYSKAGKVKLEQALKEVESCKMATTEEELRDSQ